MTELRWCIQVRGLLTTRILQSRQWNEPFGLPAGFWTEWQDIPEVDVPQFAARDGNPTKEKPCS